MATKTSYCYTTPTQSTAKKYNKWTDLAKVKADQSGGAKCPIKGKNQTAHTPSVLTVKDFFKSGRTSIPVDCDPKKLTVEYNQTLTGSAKIGKPLIEVYYNGVKKGSAYGQAPTSKNATASATINTTLKANEVNDPTKLQVKITYPANTNNNTGNLYLYWVRIKCEYNLPSYSLKINNNNINIRKDSEFQLDFTITNTAGTSYSPKPTINLPTNLSYVGKVGGDGSISQSGNTLTWTPSLTTSKTQATIQLKFKSLDVVHKVVGFSCITTSTTNSTSTEFDVLNHSLLLTLTEPDNYNVKDDELIKFDIVANCDENYVNTEPIQVLVDGAVSSISYLEDGISKELDYGEWGTFTLDDFPNSTKTRSSGFTFGTLSIDDGSYVVPFTASPNTEYSLKIGSDWIVTVDTDSNGDGEISWLPNTTYTSGDIGYIYETTTTEDNEIFVTYDWVADISTNLTTTLNITITPQDVGNLRKPVVLKISYNNNSNTYNYFIIPTSIQATYYDYIQLSEEELNRLGDGYSYELSAYLKVEEPDADSNINLLNFNSDNYENISNLELISATKNSNNYSLTLQCTSEDLYNGEFTVYDNKRNVLDTATASNTGLLNFSWVFSGATTDDYAYITYNSYYEAGIPDYTFNHRIGIFNDDPSRLINDPTGHNTTWTNTGLTVTPEESHTLLTGTGTYTHNHQFATDDIWKLQFIYLPMDEEDLSKKSVLLGSKEISFDNLGISAEEPTKIALEYNQGLLNCYVDDEFFCIYDDFEPSSSYSFGFKNYNSELTFYDFQIFELDEVKVQLNIISTAFQNTEWSEMVTEHNKWTECTVEFPYTNNNPLFIFFSGEPLGLETTETVKLKYTQPCLQEEDENNHYRGCGNYPTPFKNIINQVDELATVEGSSEQFVLYDFNNFISLNDLEDIAVQGVKLEFNAPHQENSSILCTLRSNGVIGNRSVILDEENEDDLIVVGDEFDKWGLNFGDFRNLENLELLIQHNTDATISINQPKVTIYYDTVEENNVKCYICDDDDNAVLEDTRYYGMFLQSVEINGGVDTNTEYLQVSGTDTNECYRMSLDKKEIKLNFSIRGCDFTESSQKLKRIAKLFMNERDDLNRPIPRRIMFSHYPEEYWLYVMESSIQATPNITEYDCSLTLAVPSGTSYTKEILSTNATGSNDSLVKVSPTIKLSKLSQVISLVNGGEHWDIDFREHNHLEEILISESDWLEIDCATRKVYLHKYVSESEPYDIVEVEEYCGYGNDWFLLQGEYNFQCEGATINSISFRERW